MAAPQFIELSRTVASGTSFGPGSTIVVATAHIVSVIPAGRHEAAILRMVAGDNISVWHTYSEVKAMLMPDGND